MNRVLVMTMTIIANLDKNDEAVFIVIGTYNSPERFLEVYGTHIHTLDKNIKGAFKTFSFYTCANLVEFRRRVSLVETPASMNILLYSERQDGWYHADSVNDKHLKRIKDGLW